mmetsp:Transcript_65180/g.187383  ORF Transcript_65180/g.187383 Transcript_65180/m.187383 type:complete len:256 (+) Transcript_65180:53-820(+)
MHVLSASRAARASLRNARDDGPSSAEDGRLDGLEALLVHARPLVGQGEGVHRCPLLDPLRHWIFPQRVVHEQDPVGVRGEVPQNERLLTGDQGGPMPPLLRIPDPARREEGPPLGHDRKGPDHGSRHTRRDDGKLHALSLHLRQPGGHHLNPSTAAQEDLPKHVPEAGLAGALAEVFQRVHDHVVLHAPLHLGRYLLLLAPLCKVPAVRMCAQVPLGVTPREDLVEVPHRQRAVEVEAQQSFLQHHRRRRRRQRR